LHFDSIAKLFLAASDEWPSTQKVKKEQETIRRSGITVLTKKGQRPRLKTTSSPRQLWFAVRE
jgi:hypothetical protein